VPWIFGSILAAELSKVIPLAVWGCALSHMLNKIYYIVLAAGVQRILIIQETWAVCCKLIIAC